MPIHHEQLATLLYLAKPHMDREMWYELTQRLSQFIYKYSDPRKFDGKKFLETCGFFEDVV